MSYRSPSLDQLLILVTLSIYLFITALFRFLFVTALFTFLGCLLGRSGNTATEFEFYGASQLGTLLFKICLGSVCIEMDLVVYRIL